MKSLDRLFVAAAAAAFVAVPISASQAQDFPSKPVTISIGVPAGGALFNLVQAMGVEFEERTGQPLIVEPKPGANTIIQLNACKDAEPDGYNVCLVSRSGISINPYVYENLSYDPYTEFTFITDVFTANHFYIVHSDLGVESWDELVEFSKENPEGFNYGSFGAGGDSHLFAAWLAKEAGVNHTHIPYRGFAPMFQAFQAGEIQGVYLLLGNPSLLEMHKNGDIKTLMVSGSERHPFLEGVPSMVEIGMPEDIAGVRGYFGLVGPAGIPDEIVAKLNEIFTDILRDESLNNEFMIPFAFDAHPTTPEEFRKQVEDDAELVKRLVEVAGVKLQQN